MTPLEIAKAYTPSLTGEPSTLKPERAKSEAAARAYDALAHAPNDPLVDAAYDALKREIKAQYVHITRHGVTIEPWTQPGQPYANSDEMRADVAKGHLHFFPTGAEMDETHPLAEVDTETGHRYNDLFRAVHDYFGHAVHPHQFGPSGEIKAWHEHAKMFTPLARLALTTETHGQNSWVNYGPHSHLPVKERPYAEQKAALLPTSHHPVKLSRDPKDWALDTPGGLGAYNDWLQENDGYHDTASQNAVNAHLWGDAPEGHVLHTTLHPVSGKAVAWHDQVPYLVDSVPALRKLQGDPIRIGLGTERHVYHGPGGIGVMWNEPAGRGYYMSPHTHEGHPQDVAVGGTDPNRVMYAAMRRAFPDVPPMPNPVRTPTPLPTRFRMARHNSLVPKSEDASALVRPYARMKPGGSRGMGGFHRVADMLHEAFPDHPAAKWLPYVMTHPKLKVSHLKYGARQPLTVTHEMYHVMTGDADAPTRLMHSAHVNFGTHHWEFRAPVESQTDVREYVKDYPEMSHYLKGSAYEALPDKSPTKLARVQAPAGGGIVNNTYAQGGKFMARPRRRIAEVVKALRRLKLAKGEANEPHGEPGDPIHEADGPGGRWAVWPHADGCVYVTRHDDEGDAQEHFWHPALGGSHTFPADKVHLACATASHLAAGKPIKLARAQPIGRAQLLESKGIDPQTKHLTHEDVVKLDPVLAEKSKFVGGKINASVAHLAEHFQRVAPSLAGMSNDQIGRHLLTHLSAELPDEPDPNMRDWYGPHSAAAVTGFHKIMGYPDHKDDPHQIIAKMILAITSNNAHPNLHYGSTVKILKGAKGNLANIPIAQTPGLERFKEVAPTYGLPIPTKFKDDKHAAKWAHQHKVKIDRILADHKAEEIGYYGAPSIVHPDGTYTKLPKGQESQANAHVPLLSGGKVLLPKKWSMQESVGIGLDRLRTLIGKLGVPGAAKFLVDDHHPEDVRTMAGLGPRADVAVDYLPVTGSTPGSFMFGPKIGSFFQNVHGNEKYMTADKWLGYTAGRLGLPEMFHVDQATGLHDGTVNWGKTPKAKANRELLYQVLQALIAKHPDKLRSVAQAQAILWGPEQEIANQYTVKKRVPGNFGEASRKAIKKFGPVGKAKPKRRPTLFDRF